VQLLSEHNAELSHNNTSPDTDHHGYDSHHYHTEAGATGHESHQYGASFAAAGEVGLVREVASQNE